MNVWYRGSSRGSDAQQRILSVLESHGELSREEIANHAQLSYEQVRRGVRNLVGEGCVSWRKERSYRYWLAAGLGSIAGAVVMALTGVQNTICQVDPATTTVIGSWFDTLQIDAPEELS